MNDGKITCSHCGAHITTRGASQHNRLHVRTEKYKHCKFGCGRSFAYKRQLIPHQLHCENRSLGLDEVKKHVTRFSKGADPEPDDSDSGDDVEKDAEQCTVLYGFAPQSEGVIQPKNSLMWQILRCNGCSDSWFRVDHDATKGRVVKSLFKFGKGVVLLEYLGQQILDKGELDDFKKKKRYRRGQTEYFFELVVEGHPVAAIQAEREDGTLGRLVNHSSLQDANCAPRRLKLAYPRLVLISTRDIDIGEELLYSYGDDAADALLCLE